MISPSTSSPPSSTPQDPSSHTEVVFAGLAPNYVSYEQGLKLQEEAVARLLHPAPRGTLLMLEHESVYTAGRRSLPEEYPVDGSPVIPVSRGGKVTWHGPGQLIAYPVVQLRNHFGLVDFVRSLEQTIISVASDFGVTGILIEGRTGVWAEPPGLPPEKFAQIGIRVSKGIVTHGLALNCSNSLAPFASFVPCGITDAAVTTLSRLAGHTITPSEVAPILAERLHALLEDVTE